MSVFQSVVSYFGLVRDLSLSLTCPLHCSPSVVPAFIAGLSSGIVLGLFLATYLAWTFVRLRPDLPHQPTSSQSQPPQPYPRRRRLAGYLDE